MRADVQRLRAEASNDLRAFESRVEELASLDLSSDPISAATLAQAAVALHHGYGAVEAALARVARLLEVRPPADAKWLLASMALEVPKARPAVPRNETVDGLRILLGFRQFLRDGYAIDLDRARLVGLRRTALWLRAWVVEDFRTLDEVLARLADEG